MSSPSLKITFLGTGTSQGVPLIACDCAVCSSSDPKDKRLRSSVMIETGENVFVIDTGPDFRQQMLREKVKRLDAVIFTHSHKDHLAGLDDIRAFNHILKREVSIFASKNVQAAIKREFAYIFDENKYPGIPEIAMYTIENSPFQVNSVHFVPIELMHYKMPVLGYRIGGFTYITDAKSISDEEKRKIMGSEVLVVNALRREPHVAHFTFDEAIDLIKEIHPERAYLTHISHQLGKHQQVEEELPPFIRLAYDGLKISV